MTTPSPVPAPRTMMMIGPPPHRSPCPVEQVEDDFPVLTLQQQQNEMTFNQNQNEIENESSGVSSAKSDDTPQFSHQVIT